MDDLMVLRIPTILSNILNDLIFEEYKYEEEDFLPVLRNKETMKDIDAHNLILGLEKITKQIMDPYLGTISNASIF